MNYKANWYSQVGYRRAVKILGPPEVCIICKGSFPEHLKRPMTSTHREPLQPTVEHLIPRRLGGGNQKDNLGWSHHSCNMNKGDKVKCSKCEEYKDASEFGVDKHKRNGLTSACQKCMTAKTSVYYKTPPGKAKRSARNGTVLGRERRMWHSAKQRAKKMKLDFSISIEDVTIPLDGICPAIGIPILLQDRISDNSPSLDRIDNTKGYIPGNVMVISCRANHLKRNGTAEEHRRIAEYMDCNQLKADEL